jgi:hypothetical protein
MGLGLVALASVLGLLACALELVTVEAQGLHVAGYVMATHVQGPDVVKLLGLAYTVQGTVTTLHISCLVMGACASPAHTA